MDWTIFYSDTAIILYELILICALGFFIIRLSREKKRTMASKSQWADQEQEDRLKHQIANKKRREEK